MEQRHLLQHLHELRGRVAFLRSLRPDNASYKLWLGDVVELTITVWGSNSSQIGEISGALRGSKNRDVERNPEQRYLNRLHRLDAILSGFEQIAGSEFI